MPMPQSPDDKCFYGSAKAFAAGGITYTQFLDQTLAHFNGERHPPDEDSSHRNISAIARAGPLGAMAAAMKLYLLHSGQVDQLSSGKTIRI